MDLLAELAALDRKKSEMEAYAGRIGMAAWLLPATARRFGRKLAARIAALEGERAKLLGEIRADPHANRRLQELYGMKGAELPPAQSLGEFHPSDELRVFGHRVVDWEAAEAEAERQFSDALGYYSSGRWQKVKISAEAVDAFINGLRNARDNARLSRGAALDAFQRRLESEHGVGMGPVSLQRESLLAACRNTALAPSRVDVVAQFIESQTRPRIKPPLMAERER